MVLREAFMAQYQQINLFMQFIWPCIDGHSIQNSDISHWCIFGIVYPCPFTHTVKPILLLCALSIPYTRKKKKKNFELVLYNSDLETWYHSTLPCHKLLHAAITFDY